MAIRFRTPSNVQGLLYNRSSYSVAMLCTEITVVFKIESEEGTFSQKDYYNLCRDCMYRQINKCVGGIKKLEYGCLAGYEPESEIQYITKEMPPYVMVLRSGTRPYFYCIHPDYADKEFDITTTLLPMYIGNIDSDGEFCIGDDYAGDRDDGTFLVDVHNHFFNCVRNGDHNFSGDTLKELVTNWSPRRQINRYDYDGGEVDTTTIRRALNLSQNETPEYFLPGEYEVIPYGDSRRDIRNKEPMHFDNYSLQRIGD